MGSYYLIFFHFCRKIIPKTPAACINDCGRITLVGLTSCLVRLFRRLRRATIICPQAIIAGYIIFHQTRNKISSRFVSSRPCINKLNLPRNLAVNFSRKFTSNLFCAFSLVCGQQIFSCKGLGPTEKTELVAAKVAACKRLEISSRDSTSISKFSFNL